MNLSWIDPPGNQYGGEFDWQGITYKIPAAESRNGNNVGGSVLHEFGHVLGLIHEHQNPKANKINWNKEVVYETFTGPPNNWTKEEIDRNIMGKYDEDQLNATDYDPRSIMLYFYPPEITLDFKGTKANYVLSPVDKKFIAEQYPKGTELNQIVKEGTDKDTSTEKVKEAIKDVKESFELLEPYKECSKVYLIAFIIVMIALYFFLNNV